MDRVGTQASGTYSSCALQTRRVAELCFSATVGQGPELGVADLISGCFGKCHEPDVGVDFVVDMAGTCRTLRGRSVGRGAPRGAGSRGCVGATNRTLVPSSQQAVSRRPSLATLCRGI